MPTVAHLVQKQVRELPHLEQFIERDLVSFHRLARHLRPEIEKELGHPVEDGAIVMALSRLRDRMGERRRREDEAPAWAGIEFSLRSGAVEIDLRKGPDSEERTHQLRRLLEGGPDDVFNVISGQYEITLIASARYEARFLKALEGERILNVERDLSLLYLRFPKEVLYQPGFFDRVLRELAWENINVYEVISTLTEFVLVLKSAQAAKAYDLLRTQMGKGGANPGVRGKKPGRVAGE